MNVDDELFKFAGGKTLAQLTVYSLLDYFEREVVCEWLTENKSKLAKCRQKQGALKREIIRRLRA
ncbi:MAG: hypothetical protein Q8935_24215 [Bacillota bacterium]|nr:hypothetical protein [Bacillota bacterium]